MLKTYAAVMLGGAIGTGLRLWLGNLLTFRFGDSFPVGTLTVNVLGSFIIGAFAALTSADGAIPASSFVRQVVMVGVLGGFTTFSAFSLQTLTLLEHGAWQRAASNVVLSVVLCLGAVWIGHLVAGLIRQS
jgi:CrcB protein